MKKATLLLSIVAVFICGSCALNFSETDEKEFAKKVFESVKDKSYKEFYKLVITPDEVLKLLSSTTWSEEKKNNIKGKLTQEYLNENSKKVFNEIQSDAMEYGIDLDKVKIDSVTTDVSVKEEINTLKFKVYFNSNADTYYLRGTKILKTVNGWKIADNVRLYKVD